MTKAELIERIARSRNLPPEMTKKDIGKILGIAFDELATYFAKTRVTRTSAPRFTFPRFGTFTKKKRSARRGVNPRTLEPMTIDACCTIDFKASRELREHMNPTTAAKAESKGKAASTAKTPRASAKRGSASSSKATKAKASASTRAKSKATARAPKRAAAKPVKAGKKTVTAKAARTSLGGRKLTPRDEDAELDAMIDDASLFAELPSARLQRVRPSAAGDDKTGTD